MNTRILKLVNEHRSNKWHEYIKDANFTKKGHKNLWKIIKSIVKPSKTKSNNTIHFNNVPTDKPKKCANLFNRQYTEHPAKKDKASRHIKRHFQHCMKGTDRGSILEIPQSEVESAIRKAKSSKAIGPDGISTIMLKHLGTRGTAYMTKLFNLSLATLTIPNIWKTARIIPLLKPNKDPNDAKSFRPISLLSPVVKIMEAILLPCITENIQLAPHQHGFRKNFSTTTALHTIQDQISRGLNQDAPCSRSIMVALDLSKAFDSISIEMLLQDLLETEIPCPIKRWLYNYMNGRQTYVDFRNNTSSYRRMKQGVPQGGVLSPSLFNLYMSKMPTPPEGITLVTYADDCTIIATGQNIDELCNNVNAYLNTVTTWLNKRKLLLSSDKSSATLFTTWTKQVNMELDIHINGQRIPTVKNPKILGVTFDPMLTFHNHTNQLKSKLRSRNNMLKALTGNTWGKNKETLTTTYKAISRSILNYAAPIWSPQLAESHWKNIQVQQNTSLRITTGCHKMSSQDHLHEETKILPVKAHNTMLSRQYLITCYQADHPCNSLVTREPPPRKIRRTIQCENEYVAELLPAPNINIDKTTAKSISKEIHTRVVETTLSAYQSNRVLGAKPPEVSPVEQKLPRSTRTVLAQLRSGWSKHLNIYMNRIDPTIDNKCPECGGSPHDTSHLFTCPANPTPLTALDLWLNPIQVASFLKLPTESDEMA